MELGVAVSKRCGSLLGELTAPLHPGRGPCLSALSAFLTLTDLHSADTWQKSASGYVGIIPQFSVLWGPRES